MIQEGSVNISRVQKGAQATFMWLVSGNVFRLQWTWALCGWPNMPTEMLCPLRINVNIGQHSILKLKMRGRFVPSTGSITVLSHLMIERYQEVRNDSKRTNATPASACFSTVGCAVSQRWTMSVAWLWNYGTAIVIMPDFVECVASVTILRRCTTIHLTTATGSAFWCWSTV